MKPIASIQDLISCWPTRGALASDLGIAETNVHKWAARGSIPPWHQMAVVEAGVARGIAISPERMLELHAKRGAAA